MATDVTKVVEHKFFSTLGDWDTNNLTPDNATKLAFSDVDDDYILRTANKTFDHAMVSGVPLSMSACYFSSNISKFRNAATDDRQFPEFNYFYALDVIAITGVSHQTLTAKERTSQFYDAKLYINRWNAVNYLNTAEITDTSLPTDITTLFGVPFGLGTYKELIFNKTAFILGDIEEYKEVAFMNNLVSVGRVKNKYYLIITN